MLVREMLLKKVVIVVDLSIPLASAMLARADVVQVVVQFNIYPAGGSRRSRDVLVKYLRCLLSARGS